MAEEKKPYYPFVNGVGQCRVCKGWYQNEHPSVLAGCKDNEYVCSKCRRERRKG